VIVFGVAVADPEACRRWAAAGIERLPEPDRVLIERPGFDSIQEPYNEILDEASCIDDLEAVVLLHEDTEIDDPELGAKIRRAFGDPTVAVIGPIGGRNVRSLAWWEAETFGRIVAPQASIDQPMMGATPHGWHDVDVVDGCMMVLSPWAARELRFDLRFAPYFHGYDVDLCFQARALGRRCVVGPLGAIHYGMWKRSRSSAWIAAEVIWQRKWLTDEASRQRSSALI
jgi:GT2 family glycosyltransferase